jgi:signal transduction histidine kinase
MRLTSRSVLYLILDCSLLVTSVVNIPSVIHRPGAPFEVAEQNGVVMVGTILESAACAGVRAGDIVVSWDGESVPIAELIEYFADRSLVGTAVPVVVRRGAQEIPTSIRLVPYYRSLRFLIISLFVGFTVFGVGVFILLIRPRDHAARALHWALITLGTTIMSTWGAVDPAVVGSYIVRSVWFVSYLGVAVSFLYFTLVFPSVRFPRMERSSWLLVIAVMVLGTAFAAFQLAAMASASIEMLKTFQFLFDVFHVSLFVFIGGGLLNIARATIQASSDEERRKMYWVLWGLAIGAVPYLVLHILPQIVLSQYLIPEEFTTVCFLAVPVGFAIAVLKYHLFDVELMINRTVVYGVLSFFIVAGYALVVLLMASVLGEEVVFERYFAVAAVTLLIGLVLNPLRLRLQRVVDEILFPARANFQRAVTDAEALLQRALNRSLLVEGLVKAVLGVVPADTVAVYEARGTRLVRTAFHGSEPSAELSHEAEIRKELVSKEVLVQAGAVRTNRWPVFAGTLDWSVCVPLRSQTKEVLGVLVLRQRLAQELYDEEELTFLLSVAAQAAEMLERLQLQEKMILAQEERRRLEELSNLKSYFISSVSHELRMPLTSIRMFAEMLRQQNAISPRHRREYLEIIEGESERLSRLIGNILDFAKIERGVKEYHFTPVRVDKIAKRAVLAMKYQMLQQKARLRTKVQPGLGPIMADADALEEAVLNLLSNALKYSTQRKDISLGVFLERGKMIIQVADAGIGIAESELPSIFDRFYRVRDERARQVGGAGLGLAVVKHIVEAHHGTVSVRSTVGQGTTFRIELPVGSKRARRKS